MWCWSLKLIVMKFCISDGWDVLPGGFDGLPGSRVLRGHGLSGSEAHRGRPDPASSTVPWGEMFECGFSLWSFYWGLFFCKSQNHGLCCRSAYFKKDTVSIFKLGEDNGPMAHPIRPEKYAAIDNFYTATVYNKGAEVVEPWGRWIVLEVRNCWFSFKFSWSRWSGCTRPCLAAMVSGRVWTCTLSGTTVMQWPAMTFGLPCRRWNCFLYQQIGKLVKKACTVIFQAQNQIRRMQMAVILSSSSGGICKQAPQSCLPPILGTRRQEHTPWLWSRQSPKLLGRRTSCLCRSLSGCLWLHSAKHAAAAWYRK